MADSELAWCSSRLLPVLIMVFSLFYPSITGKNFTILFLLKVMNRNVDDCKVFRLHILLKV